MSEAVTEKLEELERRVETLELLMNDELREKVENGLADEQAGNVLSLEEYEEKHVRA